MPITEASNCCRTGQGRCFAVAGGPGTWRWLKLLLVNTHLEPGLRQLSVGWQFPVFQERCQAVLCFLPQYFFFPFYPAS